MESIIIFGLFKRIEATSILHHDVDYVQEYSAPQCNYFLASKMLSLPSILMERKSNVCEREGVFYVVTGDLSSIKRVYAASLK